MTGCSSLFHDGPLDRALSAIHLHHPINRSLVLAAAAWLPLLLISIVLGPDAAESFCKDITAHMRFLVIISILVLAEPTLNKRTQAAIEYFGTSHIIDREDMPRFENAIESAHTTHNSWLPIILLLVLAYIASAFSTCYNSDCTLFAWRIMEHNGIRTITPAGWYYHLVSYPIFGYLFLLWLWKLIVWSILLRRLSGLSLNLIPTHPDQAGGLTFISTGQMAFWYLIAAGALVLSAAIAQMAIFGKSQLEDFMWLIITYIVIVPLIFVSPLIVFTKTLLSNKIKGLLRYGALANDYTQLFDAKWVAGQQQEELLGTSDIQSLADLGNSYDRVRLMRLFPFGPGLLYGFFAVAAVPFVPLIFTQLPAREILDRLLNLLI